VAGRRAGKLLGGRGDEARYTTASQGAALTQSERRLWVRGAGADGEATDLLEVLPVPRRPGVGHHDAVERAMPPAPPRQADRYLTTHPTRCPRTSRPTPLTALPSPPPPTRNFTLNRSPARSVLPQLRPTHRTGQHQHGGGGTFCSPNTNQSWPLTTWLLIFCPDTPHTHPPFLHLTPRIALIHTDMTPRMVVKLIATSA